jgi:hypothetical protein
VLGLGLDSREASLLSCCRCVCVCLWRLVSEGLVHHCPRRKHGGGGRGGVDARRCTAGFVGACVFTLQWWTSRCSPCHPLF